jgi:hypothetical protein
MKGSIKLSVSGFIYFALLLILYNKVARKTLAFYLNHAVPKTI